MESSNLISITIHDAEIVELAHLLIYENGMFKLLQQKDLTKFETENCIKYLNKIEKLKFTRHTVRQHSSLYKILGKLGGIGKSMPVNATNVNQLLKFKTIRKKSRDILRKMTELFNLDISKLQKFTDITWPPKYRYPVGFPKILYYLTNKTALTFLCQNYEKLPKQLDRNTQAKFDYCNEMSQIDLIKYTNLKDLIIDEIKQLLSLEKNNIENNNEDYLNLIDKFVDTIYLQYLHISESWQFTLLKHLSLKPDFFSSQWLTSHMDCKKICKVLIKRLKLEENIDLTDSVMDENTIIEIDSDIDDDKNEDDDDDDDEINDDDLIFREKTRDILTSWTNCIETIFNNGAEYITKYVREHLNESIDFNTFFANYENVIFKSTSIINDQQISLTNIPLQYSQNPIIPTLPTKPKNKSTEKLILKLENDDTQQQQREQQQEHDRQDLSLNGSDVICCSDDQIGNEIIIDINESLETSQMLVDRLITPSEALSVQSQNINLNKQNSSDIFDNSSNDNRSSGELHLSKNGCNFLSYQQPTVIATKSSVTDLTTSTSPPVPPPPPPIIYPNSSTQNDENEQIKTTKITQLIDDGQILSPIFEETIVQSKKRKAQKEIENMNPNKMVATCLMPKFNLDPLTFDFRRKTHTVKLIEPSPKKLIFSQLTQAKSNIIPFQPAATIHLDDFDEESITSNEIKLPPLVKQAPLISAEPTVLVEIAPIPPEALSLPPPPPPPSELSSQLETSSSSLPPPELLSTPPPPPTETSSSLPPQEISSTPILLKPTTLSAGPELLPKLPLLSEDQKVDNLTNSNKTNTNNNCNTIGRLMEVGDSIFLSSQITNQQTKNLSQKINIISNLQLKTPNSIIDNGLPTVDSNNENIIEQMVVDEEIPTKKQMTEEENCIQQNLENNNKINLSTKQNNDKKIIKKPIAIVQSSQHLLIDNCSSSQSNNNNSKLDLSQQSMVTILSPPVSPPASPSASEPSSPSISPPSQSPKQQQPRLLSPPSPGSPGFEVHQPSHVNTNQEQPQQPTVVPLTSSLEIPLIETYGSITALYFNLDLVTDEHFISIKVTGNPHAVHLNEISAEQFLKLEKIEWCKFRQLLFTAKKFKYFARLKTPSHDEPLINRLLYQFFVTFNSRSLQYSAKYNSLISLLNFGIILKDAYSELANCVDSYVLRALGGECCNNISNTMDDSSDDGN